LHHLLSGRKKRHTALKLVVISLEEMKETPSSCVLKVTEQVREFMGLIKNDRQEWKTEK